MLKRSLMAAAILVALGSPSGAQDEVATKTQAGTVDPTVLREVRQLALEADKAAAKPEPPKSEEAIAAERRAIEEHREGFFARIAERTP